MREGYSRGIRSSCRESIEGADYGLPSPAMPSSKKHVFFNPRRGTFHAALRTRTRRRRSRIVLLVVLLLALLDYWWTGEPAWNHFLPRRPGAHVGAGRHRHGAAADGIVPCVGPRGRRIDESPDDQVVFHKLGANPQPHVGSYEELGLDPEWTTAEERYGPYGYQPPGGTNPREPVQWSKVDWGQLQAQCQRENAHRFADGWGRPFNASERRIRLRRPTDSAAGRYWSHEQDDPVTDTPAHGDSAANPTPRGGIPRAPVSSRVTEHPQTNRTLLLWRTYDGYNFYEEDKINLRSLISEAALQSGGEYTVMLLVNIRDTSKKIYESEEAYDKALKEARIPEEFRSITVLWDEHLMQSWYPKLNDYSPLYQSTLPTQIVGVFYTEFDHFWILETDMRSHGHYLTFLRSLDRFSRNEPRKQALERASYFHIPAVQGPYYSGFLPSVNQTVKGSSAIWGPLKVPEVPHPIGPKPPVPRPELDNFEWGVGEPADMVSTGPCTWVFRSSWVFRDYFQGEWSMGDDTPRVFCPPATQRTSRALLRAVHAAQMHQGIGLPSESTLPSFALFHGLKISYPPQPVFMKKPPTDLRLADIYWNGASPAECLRVSEIDRDASTVETYPREDNPPRALYKGSACGDGLLDGFIRIEWQMSLSWSFLSDFPQQVLDVWRRKPSSETLSKKEGGDDDDEEEREQKRERELQTKQEEREAMQVLKKYRGKWYAPAGWWHPVKTNESP